MAAKLTQAGANEVTLIESSGGVFEVMVDGTLISSKQRSGQFPDEERLLAQIGRG